MNQAQVNQQEDTGRRKWLRRSLLIFIILVVVIVLARISLPYSIIFGATSWLEKQGVESAIEDIQIDITGGKFSVVNATGTIDRQSAFNIGRIDIHWQWRPLSDKVIHIERIALNNLNLDIQQYRDAIVIAGIHVPLGGTAPPPADPPETDDSISWAASLNEVDFSELDVCYSKFESEQNVAAARPVIDYCTSFSSLGWSGSIGFATDRELAQKQEVPVVSEGDFVLSEFIVNDRRLGKTLLDARQTRLNGVSIKGLDRISIAELDMNALSAMQRENIKHRDTLRFNTLNVTGIQLKKLNALNIEKIRVDAPGLYIARDGAGDWEYEQWIPALPAGGESKTDGNAFLIAVHHIQVNGSDFCYDEAAGQLYYCFNLDSLIWKGAAAFDREPLYITGELQLAGMKIHNHALQRDLLDIGRLSASDIDIKELDNAKLGGLVIDRLAALQRSDQPGDNSLNFNQLDISSIVFTNGELLYIGKIELDGIGMSLSMNEDGMWEHDKWKPASGENPDTGTVEVTGTDDRLDFAIGEFHLVTDQPVKFGDFSTSPPLDIGLGHIDFNINQLDSRKAAQQSPFRLKATTTRHGTIELAGVVSPFEAKPSFDAKGRIAGLDLRALTPETKKHIGHIIKSGQLDADLKLLSSGGQLDSNIGLVLHQFEIRAMSEKDASELEQTFGMPISQSLSLLRDKDNSIHLDIPITGDVNDPSFDPTDAIIKATSKATTFTLITFFTPYGLVYAGGNILFDLATALNFDPLLFDAGSAKLNTDNLGQLDKLAELMAERPQVHLTLCGLSNKDDRNLLFPDTVVAEGAKSVTLTAERKARLLKLARDRQDNTKDYMIENKGITHNRLILCEPAYEKNEDAVGGVEINI